MKSSNSLILLLGPFLLTTAPARAQYAADWFTIDGGGGEVTGGIYSVSGTIGQPDAGAAAGGPYEVTGGYWAAAQACYGNCDGSSVPPVLNISDFVCFQTRYAAGDPYANCDGSTTPPLLNISDFICFLNRYSAGCP